MNGLSINSCRAPHKMSLPPHLAQKIDQSKMVIEQALETYGPERTLIAWSGGKDSTLVLWLTREVCRDLKLALQRALDIDQADQFVEIEQFRDKLHATGRCRSSLYATQMCWIKLPRLVTA